MTTTELLIHAAIIGVVATITFDVVHALLQSTLAIPAPDWSLLGRWIHHLGGGRIMHANIRSAAPYGHERLVGWLAHYSAGTLFALILLLAAGPEWARNPTLLPPVIAGLATTGLIWFILMPAFGLGIAASASPIANRIRGINIVMHAVLGIGFFVGALVASRI